MRALEQFLYHEARLMDEGRYAEWFELWGEDAIYWVPCNEDNIDPARHVSIIYDNRVRLAERIERLKSGSVLAVEPRPRMRRVISNIEVLAEGPEIEVGSNFILGTIRWGEQQLWIGRSVHRVRPKGDSFEIARKTVLLINNDEPIPVLQFLI
jgi:3-phenylpropionate/cinnamic acid dioxygenase small subunit